MQGMSQSGPELTAEWKETEGARPDPDPSVSRTPTRTSSTRSTRLEPIVRSDPEKDGDVEKGAVHANPEELFRVTTPRDPNIVDWDGANDPEKAINWTAKRKWANIAIISSITFLTPLASSMFAPGVPQVQDEFHNYDLEIASFVVSVYVLGYALGPMVIAPLSELYGRLPLYHSCNVLFVAFTIACAKSTSMGMLIAFRLLAGIVGSCPLTIGGGSLADMIKQEKRGGAMAIWAMGPIMGPVVGEYAWLNSTITFAEIYQDL